MDSWSPGLEVLRTVNREFVHKSAVSDVFITDWMPAGADAWVAAQWPRRHWFFGDPEVSLRPLLFVETFRQALDFVSHINFAVPLSQRAVIQDLALQIDRPCLSTTSDSTTVWLKIAAQRTRGIGGCAMSLEMTAHLMQGDVILGNARGLATTDPQSGSVHDHRDGLARHRSFRPPGSERIAIDKNHPVFFDHPTSVVPQMLLLSVACDASTRTPQIRSLRARFSRQFTLTSPVWLELPPTQDMSRSMFRFHQFGRCGAEIEVLYDHRL